MSTPARVVARPVATDGAPTEDLPFLLILERTPNNFFSERVSTLAAAKAKAKKFWGSWVCFQSEGGQLKEVTSGGLGFGHASIRKHALSAFPKIESTPTSTPAAADTFLLVAEKGPKHYYEERFEDEAAARQGTKKWWASWVLYVQAEGGLPKEVMSGGLGFGHLSIKRYVVNKYGGGAEGDIEESSRSSIKHEREDEQQTPPTTSKDDEEEEESGDPLSTRKKEEGGEEKKGGASSTSLAEESEEVVVIARGDGGAMMRRRRRHRFTAALANENDKVTAAALVALMNECLSSTESGADDLVEALVQMLEPEAPTDKEMVRLRKLSLKLTEGMEGYAVASAWLAALFCRTERCIAARSRLTELVVEFDAKQREELHHAGKKLVEQALPEMLGMLSDLVSMLAKLTKDVGMQETSVRSAKGLSAAMSIAGTAMVFTPLLPVGIGLLAGGAGIGITTTTGDALGQHFQKDEMKKGIQKLNECETRVLLLLEALIMACFPSVPSEDWDAARGAGISFNTVPPEQIGNMALAIGSAGARASAGIASRVGAIAFTRVFSVLGAVVSSGDFVYSMLTNSPNRKSVEQVGHFIEGKSEQYRIWMVLLEHWLSLEPGDEAVEAAAAGDAQSSVEAAAVPSPSPAAGDGGGAADAGAAGPIDLSANESYEANYLPVDAGEDSSTSSSPEAVRRQQSARLKEAMMKAVAEPLSPEALQQSNRGSTSSGRSERSDAAAPTIELK